MGEKSLISSEYRATYVTARFRVFDYAVIVGDGPLPPGTKLPKKKEPMKRLPTEVIRCGLAALLVLAVVGSAGSQPPERVRVLIGFKNTPGPSDEREIRGRGADISHVFRIVPAMAVTIPVTALDGSGETRT